MHVPEPKIRASSWYQHQRDQRACRTLFPPADSRSESANNKFPPRYGEPNRLENLKFIVRDTGTRAGPVSDGSANGRINLALPAHHHDHCKRASINQLLAGLLIAANPIKEVSHVHVRRTACHTCMTHCHVTSDSPGKETPWELPFLQILQMRLRELAYADDICLLAFRRNNYRP